ncbi:MAG: hypothetical protein LBI60_05430 [Bacteroidales bacterium]|jgi:hypothetical protein|nr:hypothetical protein [Bacteroidales bacterium]
MMIDIYLNERTKHAIEYSIGISFSDTEQLDVQDIEKRISKKNTKANCTKL